MSHNSWLLEMMNSLLVLELQSNNNLLRVKKKKNSRMFLNVLCYLSFMFILRSLFNSIASIHFTYIITDLKYFKSNYFL